VPDLDFSVEGAQPLTHAAVPTMLFKLQITSKDKDVLIQSISLRTQIMLEAPRRQYNRKEQERLLEIFGEPERWAQTLKSMLWTHVGIVVPSFQISTKADLPVPCTFDFNVASTKYFYGLEDGEIPLAMLFSGTIFYEGEDSAMQVSQISWDKEARFRLPVQTWKKMIETYYPNMAWLCLGRDAFDRLYAYKMKHGIATWEQAIEKLCKAGESQTDFEFESDHESKIN